MHKIFILCLIAGIFLPQLGYAEKIVLPKHNAPLEEKRIHPIVEHFSKNYHKRLEKIQSHRTENFNRLLVLLIDFQEDDNSLTTGNGKFLIEPGNYDVPFGKPPHDQEFFEANLEALRYYYQAVSFGQFELSYDVYPKADEKDDFRAYTLPREMGFYNQIDGTYDEMIAGFEQYFYDALAAAETDSEIDFSQYEHIMFIHAGSDWQHDVLGDTPKDIPSFFIQMGDGKEYVTSDGIIIDNACNVPETITQDIREIEGEVYGYGLINSVMAHEFGHSLGFVDLYDVQSFRPAVGYYDIMDSGGSGLFGYVTYFHEADEERFFLIEGGAPTLPGIWTRLLVPEWKNYFETRGYLRNISELQFDETITLLPSSLKPSFGLSQPYFVKVPLADNEYLLIENRQVDPDGDGGTTFVGALPDSIDYRVLLYPTYTGGDDSPNYEYDFFLPGWFDTQGRAIGGGLLMWHIDENIIFDNDNFENNTVNTIHSKRGVRIIEADNLQDIGNYYSYAWQGTAYEPYFRFMPKFNQQGYFAGWDDYSYSAPDGSTVFDGHYHNFELSATSKPALVTNSEFESFYKLYNISTYSLNDNQQRNMSFKIGSTFFEQTDVIAEIDSIKTISNTTKSSFFDSGRPEMLVIAENEIKLFNHIYSNQSDEWLERSFYLNFTPTQPIVTFDYNNNGSEEYFIVEENQLTILGNEGTIIEEKIFSSSIIEPPLFLPEENILIVALLENLQLNDTVLPIPQARCTFNGTDLLAVNQENAYQIDIEQLAIAKTFALPNQSAEYYPVAYRDFSDSELSSFFIQTDKSEIIKIDATGMEIIFRAEYYSAANASQLALHFNQEKQQAYILFGVGQHIIKIDIFGNLVAGFPIQLENGKVIPYDFPKIIELQNQLIHFMPIEENFFFAFDNSGNKLPQFSYHWLYDSLPSHLFWDEFSTRLYFIYGKKKDEKTQLNASFLTTLETENPVLWNGFRHNKFGVIEGNIDYSVSEMELSAYAFPNPATGNNLKFKVKNAPADIELKIFDIAGNRIFQKSYRKNPTDEQDLNWNIASVSSGVYFGLVKSGSKEEKIKFAIEK